MTLLLYGLPFPIGAAAADFAMHCHAAELRIRRMAPLLVNDRCIAGRTRLSCLTCESMTLVTWRAVQACTDKDRTTDLEEMNDAKTNIFGFDGGGWAGIGDRPDAGRAG
jgi:hypothetical protein